MIPVVVTDADTQGRSPKAVLAAALTSSLGSLVALLIAWQVAGAPLDRAGLAGAATGGALALIAYAGAWLGSTGTVRVPANYRDLAWQAPTVELPEASDLLNAGKLDPPEQLRDAFRPRLNGERQ